MIGNEHENADELRDELEGLYDDQEPPEGLPDRVRRGVLVASVAQSIAFFFVGAFAVLCRSAAELLAGGDRGQGKE